MSLSCGVFYPMWMMNAQMEVDENRLVENKLAKATIWLKANLLNHCFAVTFGMLWGSPDKFLYVL